MMYRETTTVVYLIILVANLFATNYCLGVERICIGWTSTLLNGEDSILNALRSNRNETQIPTTSELTRQMSTALDASGKRIFTAYATKLNAMNNVVILDKNGNAVPHAGNPADLTLYHQIEKPLIFMKRPGSDSQYFLFTQVSSAGNDFLYRHTLDASRPGNGSFEEPLGEIVETNHLMLTNNNTLRYGASVQAIQNAGSANTTWIYFLRSSATQVQLSAKVLNASGSFGGSIDLVPVNGKAIGKIKFSPDGNQLLFSYLPPAVLNQPRLAVLRRYSIGNDGELALLEEMLLPEKLLEFEFSPDGGFIYYGLAISETSRILKGQQLAQAGNKFQLRRLNFSTQADELVGTSYDDEIFNGKHLALQRSANGRIYISAAGHRKMMVINDPDAVLIPSLTGEIVAGTDPTNAPYLSGAFATIAYDHHFHTVKDNGMFYAHRNKRQYELNDHLGNVSAVVSDIRSLDGSARVVSANNYYPFGMIMPGHNYNSADYRYGFNGMEKDDEVKGTGNSYDFGARLYDPRVGRWLTRDPLAHKFAGWSDYNAFLNNPITYVDPDGRAPKKYILVAVTFEVVGSGAIYEEAVLVVKDKKWEKRAIQMLQNGDNIRVTALDEMESWKSIHHLRPNMRGLHGTELREELTYDIVFNDGDGSKRVKYKLSIEDEVLRDVGKGPASHSQRTTMPRSLPPKIRGPLGGAINMAEAIESIADGEITPEDAENAAVAAVLMRASPAADMAVNMKPDNQELTDAYNHARHWFRREHPQCEKSLIDMLITWDSSMSDDCEENWKSGGYDSWSDQFEPREHWAIETINQVQEITGKGKED